MSPGPTHPRNDRKSYAVAIFHEKTWNHCITRQNGKSWIFLQDFSWEKWILDKNKCPIPIGQPLSLFWYFIEVREPCLKNVPKTSVFEVTTHSRVVSYNTPLYTTFGKKGGRSATKRSRRIIHNVKCVKTNPRPSWISTWPFLGRKLGRKLGRSLAVPWP